MAISFISRTEIQSGEEILLKDVRESVFKLILNDYPNINKEDVISLSELNKYRRLYLSSLINQEKGKTVELDQDVLNAITNNSLLTEELQEESNNKITFGKD